MKHRYLTVLIISVSAAASAQSQKPVSTQPPAPRCNLVGNAAVNAVREYIFYNDPAFKEENAVGTDGFIRISVHPAFDDEVFYQIRLVNSPIDDKSVIVKYSIPSNTKYLGKLIEKALKAKPCASVEQLAKSLPVTRSVLPFRKEWKPMFNEVHQLNLRPQPYSDVIWVDRTEYELEYVGTNRIRFQSDDYDDPTVKWIITVLNTIDSGG